MLERWAGKNVDLTLLNKCIEDFFNKKGFKTVIDVSARGNVIVVKSSNLSDARKKIIVKITGTPNDFVVEFVAGEDVRSSLKLGLLTTFLGGGSLLLKKLKLQEALEKLEREFWVDVESSVGILINSGKALE